MIKTWYHVHSRDHDVGQGINSSMREDGRSLLSPVSTSVSQARGSIEFDFVGLE
jgi:hypothetical protein